MIKLKRIRFDNPNLYILKTLEIGDTILLSTRGIWTITHASNGYYHCSGLPTYLQVGTVYEKVFKKEFLDWIDSLSRKFEKGDVIIGVNDKGKYVIGKLMDNVNQRITQGKIWIETDNVTTSLDFFSAIKLPLKDFKTYHN